MEGHTLRTTHKATTTTDRTAVNTHGELPRLVPQQTKGNATTTEDGVADNKDGAPDTKDGAAVTMRCIATAKDGAAVIWVGFPSPVMKVRRNLGCRSLAISSNPDEADSRNQAEMGSTGAVTRVPGTVCSRVGIRFTA